MRSLLSRSFALKAVLFILLFLSGMHVPTYVVIDDHDSGSTAAGEYWTTHHMAYGVDVVQNIGPLGFISFPNVYTGFLKYEKLGFSCLLAMVLAWLSICTAWRLPGDKTKIFFLLLVWIFTDTYAQHYLLSLLIGYALYFSTSLILSIFLIGILVILALAKGTLLFVAPLLLGALALHHALRRRWLLALLLPAMYAAFFVAGWALTGQNIAHIPAFIEASAHFSQGYNEALSYFESSSVSIFGFLGLGLTGATILYTRLNPLRRKGSAPQYIDALVLLLIEGVILFIAWKHGFTRADGHVAIFFGFLAMATPLYIWLPGAQGAVLTRKDIILRSCVMGLIIILSIAGFERTHRFRGQGQILVFGLEWETMQANADFLLHPQAHFAELDTKLAASIKDFAMPKVRAAVGDDDISLFGSSPGMMVYNNTFHYRSMPATVSFAAWNAWIMNKDATFFRESDKAPRYVLYFLETQDYRMTAQDDSIAQLELLEHYDVKLKEKEYLLLKRRNSMAEFAIEPATTRWSHMLGEWVDLANAQGPQWLRIDVPDTLLGTIMATFYKPPEYKIEYMLSDGNIVINKFIPGMARIGFMAAPLISDTQQFAGATLQNAYASYTAGKRGKLNRMVKFRILCVHEKPACAKQFNMSQSAIDNLELGRIAGQ